MTRRRLLQDFRRFFIGVTPVRLSHNSYETRLFQEGRVSF